MIFRQCCGAWNFIIRRKLTFKQTPVWFYFSFKTVNAVCKCT